MPRRNQRNKRRPQARRQADGVPKVARPRNMQRIPVEQMVVPQGKCFFRNRYGKLRFTKEEVDRALRQAQHNRKLRGSGHTEERYYECLASEGGCGAFHLTSRTEYAPKDQAS